MGHKMSYVDDYVKRLQQIQAANVAGSMLPEPASKSELANLILQKARSDFSVTGPPSMPEKKKSLGGKAKSFALGVLDKLARPDYALNAASDVAFNEDGGVGDILKGAWEGFTGKKKLSYVDVLQRQYRDDIANDPEYKRLLEVNPTQAEQYKRSEEENANKSAKAILGGTAVDLALDPLNFVGVGLVTKPFKAATNVDKALEGAKLGLRETATEALPEAAQGTAKLADNAPTPAGLAQTLSKQVTEQAANNESVQEIPRVTGKFASNRRPPTKLVEGQPVKAMYGDEASQFLTQLRSSPKFATLTDVFNRDIRQTDFEKLQKARNIHETAQVVDQVAKGNPSALDLITYKNIEPLAPVARKLVDNSVKQIVREIVESVADPAKARALGKQPRHPVFNAPTQSNLSSRLTNAARSAFKAETIATPGATGVAKPAAPGFIPAVFSKYLNMLKNAEESLIAKGRDELNDAYYPRGGIKPDSPYLRLSDVLEALPRELAQKAILGPRQEDKILPSLILKAITGNNSALGKIAKKNKDLFNAIQSTDWTPLMVKEYATRTIDAANALHKTTNDVAGFISEKLADTSSDVSKAAVVDATVKAGKREFNKEMPAAKASLSGILDGIKQSSLNPMPNIVDTIIERGKQRLAANVLDSSKALEAQPVRIAAAANGIEEITGTSAKQAAVDPALASQAADNVFSTVLSWIKPNMGYKDLRPVLLKNISVRKSSAAVRAHEIIKIFGAIPVAEHMDFWNEVRGFIPPIESHAESVAQMQKMFGNMFGESGLAEKLAGNTSLARAGINIDHLNKHLRIVGIKDFKFERDVPDPLKPGKKIRLEGAQILDGWKTYHPKTSEDMRVFTHNLTQAVENSMVEYSIWSNLGALSGSTKPGRNLIQVSGMHPAVDGMYFPKDLAPQMGKVARGIDEMFESVSNSKLMRAYDSALRTWKTGVTIYAPSHHIRNMIGDVFMAYLDGVSNPTYYTKAATMMKANFHRYSDIKTGKDPLKNILGEGREAELIRQISGQTVERIPKGTRVIATARIGNKKFPITIDQAYQMAYRHGIFPHAAQIEDLPGTETLMEKLANRFHPDRPGPFQPVKGKAARGVRQVSETREHFVRGAHWLHALENTKANSLEELFQKSADRVRKYHPDGLDLTPVEKKVFRRIIPFYSWTRKAIPLVLEGLVMHPAKILAYPKIAGSVQESQGIETSLSDPWPDDQLFPDWLSSNVIGPTIPWDSSFARAIARSDSEVGYGVIDPTTPATQILEDYGNNPVKGIANSVTPFLKIPAEIATGHQVQSGAPVGDTTEYLDKNIPLLSTISRITNGAIGTGLLQGGDLKGKETQPANIPAFINYLTGAGMLDTGRYTKGGEFDLKKRLAEERKNGSK